MVMIFVNKKRRSLVDVIAATDVYDNDFLIYKDADEQYEYNVKLAKYLLLKINDVEKLME